MMISIKPVTRIEGHLQVLIKIREDDVKVQLKAWGFRGFEKILTGRPVEEAIHIAPRICGVCSVAHHLAAVKAVDSILGVDVPEAAKTVREVMGLSGVIESHLLHLGFLLYPDLEREHELHETRMWKSLVALRSKSKRVTDISGGRHVHPFNAVPGGVLKIPPKQDIEVMVSEAESGLKLLRDLYEELWGKIDKFLEENTREIVYVKSPLATLTKDGEISFYEGLVKITDDENTVLIHPSEYVKFIVEEPVDYSYSKKVYVLLGETKKPIRVGPLPRLLSQTLLQYDISRELYKNFKSAVSKLGLHPLISNLARIVEIAYCFEKMLLLLDKLRDLPPIPRTKVSIREGEGVGVVEAPRGLLIHHYKCNRDGIITYANIITPTTINLAVVEDDIRETVKSLVSKHSNSMLESYLKNKVLYLVRSYDPCVSCAVHVIHVAQNNIHTQSYTLRN